MNSYGETPLHLAAREGHLEIVEKLLEKGADVNAVDRFSRTPLVESVWSERLEILKKLLEKGANPTIKKDLLHKVN